MFLRCAVFIVLCSPPVLCDILDYSLTNMISINDTSSYFGFSILLQQGNPPIAIVGAPKRSHDYKTTGAVYKCDLKALSCTEYNIKPKGVGVYTRNGNGDFLGASLDGNETLGGTFFSCAPRFTTIYDSGNYFTNGRCFMVEDSRDTKHEAVVMLPVKNLKQIGSFYGNSAYYEAAFAQSGFDVKYSEENAEIILGDPGKSLWSGGLTRIYYTLFKSNTLSLNIDLTKYHDNYLGYSVSYGKFTQKPHVTWYVAGAPRGNKLNGQVILFRRSVKSERLVIERELFGEELGSYFGASLLVLQKAGNNDDILVGAPMHSGNSWDKGCVYYYKNLNNGIFKAPSRIFGRQSGSRFGTVIQDIGDIDLDYKQDIIISAPYEDDGVGAVYLFYGTEDGFSYNNYERISPSDFQGIFSKPMTIRGFGLGISKGIDLDGNLHNDIAIGAFKSGQVFYFRSSSVVDLEGSITSSIDTLLTATRNFTVKYCVKLKLRNKLSFVTAITAEFEVSDGRVLNARAVNNSFLLNHEKVWCKNYTIFLKNSLSLEPLSLLLKGKRDNGKGKYTILDKVNIPVFYGCGQDNICETDLSVKATAPNTTSIILGRHKDIYISATIENSGEPAYQTELYLSLPSNLNLVNLRECNFQNKSYVCLISDNLQTNQKIVKSFHLDVDKLDPQIKTLDVNITVKSLGIERNAVDNNVSLQIPVKLENRPYMYGEASPTIFQWDKITQTIQIIHVFRIGNDGPSPVDIDFTVLIPNLDSKQAFEIESVEGTLSGILAECDIYNESSKLFSQSSLMDENCAKKCLAANCRGGYFSKSSETAAFSVKIIAHFDVLSELFKNIDLVNFTTVGYLRTETTTIKSSCSTIINGLMNDSRIPLWISVVSAILGVILLLLLSFMLYKCNFFNRTYKTKLENEQGLIELFSEHENEEEEEVEEDLGANGEQ